MKYTKAKIKICKGIIQGEPQYRQAEGYTTTINDIKLFTSKISNSYWITREYKTGFETGKTYAKTIEESVNNAIKALKKENVFNREKLNNFIKLHNFKQINF